jgi:hypothetical protein
MGKLLGFTLIICGLLFLLGGNVVGAVLGIVAGLFGLVVGIIGAVLGIIVGGLGGLIGIVTAIGLLLLPIILVIAIIGGIVKLVACL